MKSIHTLILLGVIFTCSYSCTANQDSSAKEVENQISNGSTSNNASYEWQSEKDNAPNDRKIIWTGNLELQVKDVDKTSQQVDSICTKFNAFVSNMRLTNNRYEISNRITIRVNNKDFNAVLNEIKGQSIYTRKVEITSNDVSEEFVDIESRLKTKKEVRERYINILKTKTGDIKDVIEAEEAIRKITEEIEAKEGRLRFLNDQVSFSTINLQLFQKVEFQNEPKVYEKSFFAKTTDALQDGWEIVTGIFYGLLRIWPIVIMVSLVLWRRKALMRLLKK